MVANKRVAGGPAIWFGTGAIDNAPGATMSEPLAPELRDLLALTLVPGLGPRLTAALLRHFGSAGVVRRASAAELRRVPQIGEELSQELAAALKSVGVDADGALRES